MYIYSMYCPVMSHITSIRVIELCHLQHRKRDVNVLSVDFIFLLSFNYSKVTKSEVERKKAVVSCFSGNSVQVRVGQNSCAIGIF